MHPVRPKEMKIARGSSIDLGDATLAAAFLAGCGINSATRTCGLFRRGNAAAIACRAMPFGQLLAHFSDVQIHSAILKSNRVTGPRPAQLSGCIAQALARRTGETVHIPPAVYQTWPAQWCGCQAIENDGAP